MSINPPPPLTFGEKWIGTERRDYIERFVFRMTGMQLAQVPKPDDDETNLIIGSLADLIAQWPTAEPKPIAAVFLVADSAGQQFRDTSDYLALELPELVFLLRLMSGVSDPGPVQMFHGLNILWAVMSEAQGDDDLTTAPLIALLDAAQQEAREGI